MQERVQKWTPSVWPRGVLMLYSGINLKHMKQELIDLLRQASELLWEVPKETKDRLESIDLFSMMMKLDDMLDELEENDLEDF